MKPASDSTNANPSSSYGTVDSRTGTLCIRNHTDLVGTFTTRQKDQQIGTVYCIVVECF